MEEIEMTTIELDGRKMDSRSETHQYLMQELKLPEYYGKNLDALYDCLTELHRVKIVLTYKDAMLNSLGAYGQSLLQVLKDAAQENPGLIFVH